MGMEMNLIQSGRTHISNVLLKNIHRLQLFICNDLFSQRTYKKRGLVRYLCKTS
jgi:hypothetical protein